MRKFTFLFTILLLLGVGNLYSQTIKKGPYMIYPNDNTQMTILWQLSASTTCTLEWGETTSYGNSQTVSEYGSDHQFQYTITGLTPATKYYYRVSFGSTNLTGSFRTAPADNATSVKFLAYGDTRTYYMSTDDVSARMLTEISNDPEYQTFCIHTGDWVNKGQNANEDEWGSQFFNRSGTNNIEFHSKVAIMGARGNHENYTENYSPYEAASNFYKYFPYNLATTPSESGDDMYYSFDYGPVHIAVLDQYDDNPNYNTLGSAQKTWLENDLANTDKPWKFIVLHEPGWSAKTTSKSEHSNNTDVQNNVQPLCVQYGVQAVFGGHNHYYAHCLVNGVHHFTLGGGGAPLYDPSYTSGGVVVKAEKTYHFMKVEVDGNNATLTVVRPNGTIVETINLTIPIIDPSNFTATPVSSSQIDLSWTQNADNDDILLAYNTTNTFGTPSGNYTVGDVISGGGEVIALGDIDAFSHTGLSAQTYYYKIWSKHGTDYSEGVTTSASPLLPEPTNHVTDFAVNSTTSSTIDLTWTDATGGTEPTGYLIKANLQGNAISDPVDGNPEADGTYTKNVNQGMQTVTFNGLNPSTSYDFKIFPYTNSGSQIDYKTDGTVPTATGTTTDAPTECGHETFDNLQTGSSSYADRSWTGQDGSTWTATNARTDQEITSGNPAICFRNGYIQSGTISGGISDITMTTKRVFSGGSGNLTVYINGSQVGTIPYSDAEQTSSVNDIDISGDIVIKIVSTDGTDRVVVDDIIWTCYSCSNIPTPPDAVSASATEICSGSSTTLTYSGGSGDTFVWYAGSCGSTNVGTGNNLTVTPTETTTYYGRWENDCGESACLSVTVNVIQATQITAQPQSQTVCESNDVTFTVSATGDNLTYQWQKDGSDISGATTNSLTIPNVSISDEGDYTCIVSGDCGSVTSDQAVLTVEQAIVITEQPQNITATVGDTVYFYLTVTGDNPSYQWFKDDNEITDANSDTLYLYNVTTNDAGTYHCIVINDCGSATSENATLTVLPTNIDKLSRKIVIIPNPNDGHFSLSVPYESAKITIYDINGQKVFEKECDLDKNDFNLNNLSSGFYLIKLENEKISIFKKLIIEK